MSGDHDMTAPVIIIDLFDAAELASTCELLAHWIPAAGPALAHSLRAFAGPALTPAALGDTLGRLHATLVRAVPSVTPHPLSAPTPLSAGETFGLAELLIDLADGWPADPDHAQAVEDDCRRWARRLLRVPGLVP